MKQQSTFCSTFFCKDFHYYFSILKISILMGTAVAQWLRCCFDPRWCHWNFSLT